MTQNEDPTAHLGRRIHALRRGKGLSLREVSTAAGVSESFLSQVERGKTSPSIASLHRLAAALDEPMPSLFSGPSQPARLVRAAERGRMAHLYAGEEDTLLTPRDAQRMQLIQSEIEPGGGSGDEQYSHGGEEECVLVLSGTLTISVADQEFLLEAGDVLLLDPREGHAYRNDGKARATVLWITVPPP